MVGFVELPVAILAKLIVDILRKTKASIEISPSGGIKASIKLPTAQKNIDERLEKIGQARENLSEALQAIDELRESAEDNRRDLQRLNEAIIKAENQKQGLRNELSALKQLADIDSNSVREALRLPTEVDKWKERIWGFIFGILAAVIVTIGWELGLKPFLESHRPQLFQSSPASTENSATKKD